jgi:hypothetical protein
MTKIRYAHPDAPAGGGGPGFFRHPRNPGALNLDSGIRQKLHVPDTTADRMLTAATLAVPKLPRELRKQVAAMLTRETMAVIAASAAILAGSQVLGIGEVVDVIFVGVGFVTLGRQAVEAGERFVSFWRIAKSATSEKELGEAANYFADAVTIVGLNSFFVLIAHRSGSASTSASKVAGDDAFWPLFHRSLKFDVPESSGVLWTGIGADRALLIKGTMENTLEDMGLYRLIQARVKGVEFENARASVWKPLSVKYAQSLRGRVKVFVNRTELETNLARRIPIKSILAKEGTSDIRVPSEIDPYPKAFEALLMSEIDALTELLDNPKVTIVEFWDDSTKKLWKVLDMTIAARAAKAPKI